MFRARLASLVLSGGLVMLAGCTCGPSFRLFNRSHSDCGCECGTTVAAAAPCCDGGPALVPGDMTTAPVITPGSTTVPPPRIVPVPQSTPVPYQPTGLRRIFGSLP